MQSSDYIKKAGDKLSILREKLESERKINRRHKIIKKIRINIQAKNKE